MEKITRQQLIVLAQAVTLDEVEYHYRSPERKEALSLVDLGLLEFEDRGDWERFTPTKTAQKRLLG